MIWLTLSCEWDCRDRERSYAMTGPCEFVVDAMLASLVAQGEAAEAGLPPPPLALPEPPLRDARRDRVQEGNVVLWRPRLK